MDRITCNPRSTWQEKVASHGLTYHTGADGHVYWNEGACYRFRNAEIDEIERATNELHALCLEAVQWVIDHRLYDRLGIPEQAIQLIEHSWQREPESPYLYGRFDLCYDGRQPPKLFEYNADTPTALIEAAVTQWYWKQHHYRDDTVDQFNSIHEKLIERWRTIASQFHSPVVHFGYLNNPEDVMTVAYLMDTATQAGLAPQAVEMACVRFDPTLGRFLDGQGMLIQNFFKLYPWEWLVTEEFGAHLSSTLTTMHWIEPAWKMLLSNKGILAILWELFPDHPNLLPCYMDGPQELTDFVKKPFLSREGANVELYRNYLVQAATKGPYQGRAVYQAVSELPNFGGNRPVIGSWVIGNDAAGIGIRESSGLITDNTSRFVPHIIL